MLTRVCFAYAWATSGGVERVFLNRAEALLRRDPRLKIDIYFHSDCGGGALFLRYVNARGLADRLSIVTEFDPSRYDRIFCVDTPQILIDHRSAFDKIILECHTPYAEHRAYLREWQMKLQELVVPSAAFRTLIETECQGLRGKVAIIRNFIPRPCDAGPEPILPAWEGNVFIYLGRIDANKNVTEFVDAITFARHNLKQPFWGIVCGPIASDYYFLEKIDRSGARGYIVVLPPVPFENTHRLFRALRRRGAVYVSSSKGESFGLAPAEAMTAAMPVILSDIPPHCALVRGRAPFLYQIGNVAQLAAKMVNAIGEYHTLAVECESMAAEFSESAFLTDWDNFLAARHLARSAPRT